MDTEDFIDVSATSHSGHASAEDAADTVIFSVPPIFLDPAGDLILESSDGHRFQIFRAFLIFGSTFFRDMFSHPQPTAGGLAPTEPLKWDEPGHVIALILYRLHPVPERPVPTWKQLVALAKAADKWGIESVLTWAKTELLKPAIFRARPFVVYKVAHDIGCTEFQSLVRRELVAQHDPLDPDIRDGLECLTALELCKLVDMRAGRLQATQRNFRRSLPRRCPVHSMPWMVYREGTLRDEYWDSADLDRLSAVAAKWGLMPKGTPYTPELIGAMKRAKDSKLRCQGGCVLNIKEVLEEVRGLPSFLS